jgi:hypothetical protein
MNDTFSNLIENDSDHFTSFLYNTNSQIKNDNLRRILLHFPISEKIFSHFNQNEEKLLEFITLFPPSSF